MRIASGRIFRDNSEDLSKSIPEVRRLHQQLLGKGWRDEEKKLGAHPFEADHVSVQQCHKFWRTTVDPDNPYSGAIGIRTRQIRDAFNR